MQNDTSKQGNEAKPCSTSPVHTLGFASISLWDGNGFSQTQEISDKSPTGRQVLKLFGKHPAEEHILLMLSGSGSLQAVKLDEPIQLAPTDEGRFFAFQTDRLWTWSIDSRRFCWGAQTISSKVVRLIANISEDEQVYLEKRDTADQLLDDEDCVDLDESGLERLYSKKCEWKLNVQGVLISVDSPIVSVKSALEKAGFDSNDSWIVILKRKGEPKVQLSICDEIDLSTPGIEKLRLTPKEINNGEGGFHPRRNFGLLDKDEEFLDKQGLRWETIVERGTRWLLIHNLALPEGYNHSAVDIAINVPATYPHSQIDMFYCHPVLLLKNGTSISQTESRQTLDGKSFQRWSRHLSGRTRWNPQTDSVRTHLAVVEECLLREVEK